MTPAWILDHLRVLVFGHSLTNILVWVLVFLSHVQVPNMDSYHPKTVTLDPSPACVGIGSIWIFIGISTSFFSLGHFLTTRIPYFFHVPMNATLLGWCLGRGCYVCTFLAARASANRHSTVLACKAPREKKKCCLFHTLRSSFGRLLSLVDLLCHY